MRFLDTNIFVRYLAGDDTKKTEATQALLVRLQEDAEKATTSESVLAETVYVLGSPRLYSVGRADLRARLLPILALPGLMLPVRSAFLRALDLYVDHPFLDIEDALSIAHMQRLDITEIVSYDEDFDRVPDIKRIEP